MCGCVWGGGVYLCVVEQRGLQVLWSGSGHEGWEREEEESAKVSNRLR